MEVIQRLMNKNVSLSSLLLIVCLSDWFYKVLRLFIGFEYFNIIYYFTYILNLWSINKVITLLIIFICLLGIPRFVVSLRKCFNITKQFFESILKRPIVVNVPAVVYLLIIIFKCWLLIKNFIGDNSSEILFETPTKQNVKKEIGYNLFLYPYSTLFTFILFIFGLYTIINNQWVNRMSKRVFTLMSKYLNVITKYLSITIPTRIYLLILLAVDILIQSLSILSSSFSNSLQSPLKILCILIICLCIYAFFKYLMPKKTFDLNFTGKNYTRFCPID